MLGAISNVVTLAAFSVRHLLEGEAPARDPRDAPAIDCPDHGKTTLTATRRTRCCDSLQFVPSGNVKSRACRKRAGRRRRKKTTIICDPDRGYPLER